MSVSNRQAKSRFDSDLTGSHRLRIRIRMSVRFSSAPFGCDPGATAALTEERMASPPFGDCKIFLPLLRQALTRALPWKCPMEPDAAYSTPSGRQPTWPKVRAIRAAKA